METPSQASAWAFDKIQNKFVYTGDRTIFSDLVNASSLSVLDFFDHLGLKAPKELAGGEVSFQKARVSVVADVPEKMYTGLSSINILGKRELAVPKVTAIRRSAPLPPLDICIQKWRTWFSSRSEISEFQTRVALHDALQFLQHKKLRATQQIDTTKYLPGECIPSAILSGFLFTYDLSEPSFWCVFMNERWSVHARSADLEHAFSLSKDIIMIDNETIDFVKNVVHVDNDFFSLRRVTSSIGREVEEAISEMEPKPLRLPGGSPRAGGAPRLNLGRAPSFAGEGQLGDQLAESTKYASFRNCTSIRLQGRQHSIRSKRRLSSPRALGGATPYREIPEIPLGEESDTDSDETSSEGIAPLLFFFPLHTEVVCLETR